MADRIGAGEITYTGLDPDLDAIETARASGLPLRLVQATIENLDNSPGGFRHVIALRSLNHFVDVERALTVIAAALQPGGTLLLIESLPLPLLRGRRHAKACHETAAGGFQHFRNWSSHRTLEILHARLPFRVLFHRPIGRDTCDQWILQLERT